MSFCSKILSVTSENRVDTWPPILFYNVVLEPVPNGIRSFSAPYSEFVGGKPEVGKYIYFGPKNCRPLLGIEKTFRIWDERRFGKPMYAYHVLDKMVQERLSYDIPVNKLWYVLNSIVDSRSIR